MNFEPDDAELREQFQRLKRQDEGMAPSFSSQWDELNPRARTYRGWTLNYRLAGAALAILLLAGILLAIHNRGQARLAKPPEATLAELSGWRAPTDWLLRTPGGQLLQTVPRLGEPLIGSRNLSNTETK